MEWYSRSRSDFLELLYAKYQPMEEVLWCIWLWEQNTDYVLCNGDSDLLPPLVKKDEIRFSYNQYKNKWSYVSCTIFAAVWMLSDLMNYEFSYDEIKEIDELSYTRWRIRGQWWWVQSAVKLVADRWNEKHPDKQVAFYRISKYDNEIIEDVIGKLYTIDWNLGLNSKYNEDKKDWMIDGTDFGTQTSWHSVCVVNMEWQRSVKDSWSVPYYWLKNKLSAITNFWAYFYVYVPVEDKLERVKKLNEIKAKIVNWMGINSELWHLSWSEEHKNKLHDMNNFFRDWLSYIDGELKELQ